MLGHKLTVDHLIHAGRGPEANSAIFLARRNGTTNLVVKLYDRVQIHQPDVAERLLNERRLLEVVSTVPHAFVVGFHGALLAAEGPALCIDHAGGGDLFTLLQRHGPFAPEHARIYVGQICLALEHIHSFDVIHRNLTSENVLVTLDGHLKLADFGSAKQMLGRDGSLAPPRATLSLVGTPSSMAPEVLVAEPACEDVDQWSLGVLSNEILSGATPFEPSDGNVEVLMRNILCEPYHPPNHPHIGLAETAFLTALLQREPDARLGSRATGGNATVFAHPWFAGLTVHSLLTKQVSLPCLPFLSGKPSATPPPPPSTKLIAMAALHAQGTPPKPPAAGTWVAEWATVGFESAFGGQPAHVVFKSSDIPVAAVVHESAPGA